MYIASISYWIEKNIHQSNGLMLWCRLNKMKMIFFLFVCFYTFISSSSIYTACLQKQPRQQFIWLETICVDWFLQMSREEFHRFGCHNSVCCWYLRLHFLQQVPSTCTGSESSEQFAGGQKILRHSTTPFCIKIVKTLYVFYSFV